MSAHGQAAAEAARVNEDAVDKYAVASSPAIDCAALLPLCSARCCSLVFSLSRQDVAEAVVRWNLRRPYQIAQTESGMCVHNRCGRCDVYAHRPVPCRTYDCRTDPRIWSDFDKRIPAAKGTGTGTHV